MTSDLAPKRTLFHAEHLALNAHMVSFAGWEMPLYYPSSGIVGEHRAVREGVGLFDVSHMSIVTLTGPGAAGLICRRTPLNAGLLKNGACRYTFFLNTDGRIIDDAVVSRLDERERPSDLLLVSNAAMTQRIMELLLQHRPAGTDIRAWNGKVGILAVQGPRSRILIKECLGWDLSDLKFYSFKFFPWEGGSPHRYGGDFEGMLRDQVLVSRTGYTGELGYELFLPELFASKAWDRLVKGGGIPCGLGARDSLRMEKGFLLSGTDFQEDKTPLEAGLDRFLAFDHPFVGRPALEKQRAEGTFPILTGLQGDGQRAIPRHGMSIYYQEKIVGRVTSGGQSPTLGCGIALAYLPSTVRTEGTSLEIEIRGKRVPVLVVPLPFVK